MKLFTYLAAATIVCLVSAYPAVGQSLHGPLKVARPDTLKAAYFQASTCPCNEDSINSMIDGLLVRSRLKRLYLPLNIWMGNPLTLTVHANCSSVDEGHPYIYTVSAAFRETVLVDRPSGKVPAHVYHNPFSHGAYGTINLRHEYEEKVRQAVRKSVESVLTDYLKANFDL